VALALIAAYAGLYRVRFTIGYGYTAPTQLALVPMLFLLPAGLVPLAVVGSLVLGNLPDYLTRRTHPDHALLLLGNGWHAIAPAVVFGLTGAADDGWGAWPLFLAALAAQFLSDALVSGLRDRLALGIPVRLQPTLFSWVLVVDLLLAPVGLLAAMASRDADFAFLAALPLAGLLAVFARERQQRIDHALELNRAYRGTTLLLSDVLDADDEYTGEHSRSVVSLAVAVADEMGLGDSRRRGVEFGALLHDVGKIAVPSEIINKPGPLTDDEWTVIKAHTIEGQRMLDQVGGVLSEVGRIVRSSHERWDGDGYPDGLKGAQIPLESAIVCAADAFNAMTTDRSYRKGRPPEEALAELLVNSGTQFRPDVVGVLTRLVEEDLRARGSRIMGAHEPQLA
jgi:putative nucleotidyltransferase with HDIG domain